MSRVVDWLFVSVKSVTDAKHVVLNLAKIKHIAPETRLSPHLFYFSRLEQMSVELTDFGHVHVAVSVIATYFARNLA